MARKRFLFQFAVQSILRLPQMGKRIHASLTFLSLCLGTAFLALYLSTGISSVAARMPVVNPIIIQALPNALQLVQQGRERYDAGQFSQAATVWQQAMSAFKTQGDVLNQAMILSNLSSAYQQLGQWPQATTAITSSLNLLQTPQHGDASKERLRILAQALNTQGSLQLAMGESEKALETWQQATTSYKKAGLTTGIIGSLLNQAQAEQSMGLYLKAKDTLIEVTQDLTSQPDSLVKTKALLSLGNTLRIIGDLGESRKDLQQSLEIAQKLNSPSDIGAALLSLGNTAYFQQDHQAALMFFQQAVDVSTSPIARTQAKLNQLNLLSETKSWSEAQALWPQIQSEIGELPPSRSVVYARINLAQSLTRLRQASSPKPTPSWLDIEQLLSTAVEQAKNLQDQRAQAYALGYLGGIYEQTTQWSNAQKLTQQALILAQAINAPDIGYRWQWQLGRLLKAQGDTTGAIAAYTEAVENLKSLRNNLVGVNPDIQFSFRDQVEPVYRQLVDLLLQGQEPSQENLVQARSVIESLQLAELNNFFRAACLEEKAVDLDQVIDRQDPTAAVIYPIILPDRLEVILKLPQQKLRHYKTPVSQFEVEKLSAELREKLTKPETVPETKSLSKEIYDWLIRPAAADLAKSPVKTLVFVLDGSLRNIPMAALWDGQQYLVQKYAIALTPGLQLLPPKAIERVHLKSLTAGLTESRSGFPALEHVSTELSQIKSKIPGTELLNQKFTSDTLQTKIDSNDFPIVHIATHGQFSSRAEQTFILAWDGRINVNKLNDFLQNIDQRTHNALELLVLSACQTAAGDNRAALGLAGFAVQAGARSTLASLWSLNDTSVPLFMIQFYDGLTKNHLTKAEALRQAQLELLAKYEYHFPMFWASYVLVGNWR